MRVLARAIGSGALVVLLLIRLAALAAAQSAAASLQVSVSDAGSGTPLAFARVFLIGPRNVSALSGERGEAVVDDLVPGAYALLVSARGYASASLREIPLESGRTVTVTVKLQKTGVKKIGSVAVRSSPTAGAESAAVDGTEARLSENLVDALGFGTGLDVTARGGASLASVDGRDPGAIGVSVDGVPVALGSPARVDVLPPSLFAGLALDRSGTSGSTAALDFRTADPTIAWQSTLQPTLGARARSFVTGVRGSAGFVGISYSHAADDVFGPLQGSSYEDQSRLTYPHDDVLSSRGDALKLRLPFAGQVFGLSAVRGESTDARACDRLSAPLPCGYGPGNAQHTALQTLQVRDTAVIGATALSVTLFSSLLTEHDAFAGRILQGTRAPVDATVRVPTNGFQWTAAAPAGTAHSVSLTGYQAESRAQSFTAPGEPPELGDRVAFRTLTLTDAARLTRALRASLSIGRQGNARASSTYASASATFDGAKDRLTLRYSAGALSPSTSSFEGLSDPASSQFDCGAGASFGTGPEHAAAKSTTTAAGLSWLRRLHGDDQIAVSARREVVYDGTVTTTIGAADVAASLPAGYAERVAELFGRLCGSAPELSTAHEYLYAGAIAPRVVYGNLSVAGRFALGSRGFVQPHLVLTSAVEHGETPFIASPASSVIPGAQLPEVPRVRGGAIAGLTVGKTQQMLLGARYTGENNAQHLPAHWTLDAAYGIRLRYGTLSVVGLNLTGAYPGPFASSANAVPLRTRSGAAIPTVATPPAPRTLLLRYRVAIGKPASASAPPELDADDAGGEGPSFELLPFSAPATDPFAVQTAASSCGPERAEKAAKALAAVKRFASAQHRGDDELARDGALLAFRRHGASYSVLVGGRRTLLDALFACAAIHGGAPGTASLLGLYAPTREESKRFELAFSPAAGFYVGDVVIASESVRTTLLPLPERPPADPFALRPPAECPAEVRSAAAAMLQKLAGAANAADDAALRGFAPWTIVRRGGALEASLPDPSLATAVARCAYVHAADASALRARGFEPPVNGAFGFAAALGIFVGDAGAAR